MPSQEALKHGPVSESLSMIEDAVAMAQRAYVPDQMLAPLLRTRAITNLRGVESHISGSGARVEVKVAAPQGERSIHRAPGCVSSFGGSGGAIVCAAPSPSALERAEEAYASHELPTIRPEPAARVLENIT